MKTSHVSKFVGIAFVALGVACGEPITREDGGAIMSGADAAPADAPPATADAAREAAATPTDASADDASADATAVSDHDALVREVCGRFAMAATSCGAPACLAEERRHVCETSFGWTRDELVRFAGRCADAFRCGPDGRPLTTPPPECGDAAMAVPLEPTAYQRQAFNDACAVCPGLGGGTTSEACARNLAAGDPSAMPLLTMRDDALRALFTRCAPSSAPDCVRTFSSCLARGAGTPRAVCAGTLCLETGSASENTTDPETGTTTITGCSFDWASCSDGHAYRAHCERVDGSDHCECRVDGATVRTFDAPDFCADAASDALLPSVAMRCGWDVRR